MSVVAIKQSTSVLRYHLLASVVCDINLKLSRNKGGSKQLNIVFHYCFREIMPLDLRTSPANKHQKCKFSCPAKSHETKPLKYQKSFDAKSLFFVLQV